MTAESRVTADLDRTTRVGTVSFARGRANYFDALLLEAIADAVERVVADGARAVILRSSAKHFCAGMDVTQRAPAGERHVYDVVPRLFRLPVPVVAAVHGAAIGGGLGLALACDFRVADSSARLAANFARLGFSQGFALTLTLPAVIGSQRAAELLYTGRRMAAPEALAIGLCDRLAEPGELDAEAAALAAQIAGSAPLAVAAMRTTLRAELLKSVEATLVTERAEQERLMATSDFREALRAARDRREPQFTGH